MSGLVGLNQTFKMTLDLLKLKKDNKVVLNTTKEVGNKPNSKVQTSMSICLNFSVFQEAKERQGLFGKNYFSYLKLLVHFFNDHFHLLIYLFIDR